MAAIPVTDELVRERLPARPADAHKGTFGRLFIIGGSRRFTGAPKMAAMAAGRSGVGLVTVGVPEPLGYVIAAGLLESMSLPLPATEAQSIASTALDAALDFARAVDAVAVGPGMSQHADTQRFVVDFVAQSPKPLVIDADGLNALSTGLESLKCRSGPCVLTPHPGEMARLASLTIQEIQAGREQVAARFAQDHDCTVVLKGKGTVIADAAGACYVNPTGNEGMATGGTGDVLTGLIGGLLAQGLAALDAALVGVYVHGLAGDFAKRAKTSRGVIAPDLIDHIPDAWRALDG